MYMSRRCGICHLFFYFRFVRVELRNYWVYIVTKKNQYCANQPKVENELNLLFFLHSVFTVKINFKLLMLPFTKVLD